MLDKAKASMAWLYNWITVAAGIALGGVAMIFEILDASAGLDLAPLFPAEYAARIVTAVAVAKALHAFYLSRRK